MGNSAFPSTIGATEKRNSICYMNCFAIILFVLAISVIGGFAKLMSYYFPEQPFLGGGIVVCSPLVLWLIVRAVMRMSRVGRGDETEKF